MAELVDGWSSVRELAHGSSDDEPRLLVVWECTWTDPDGERETYRAVATGRDGELEAWRHARTVLSRHVGAARAVSVRSREVVITPGAWISQGVTLDVALREIDRINGF